MGPGDHFLVGQRVELVVTTVMSKTRWNADAGREEEQMGWLADLTPGVGATVWSATTLGKDLGFDQTVPPRIAQRQNTVVLPIGNPMKSQECPGYLHYIIDRYHSLPDYLILVHGNPNGHGAHGVDSIRAFAELALDPARAVPDFDFVHLNTQRGPECVNPDRSPTFRILDLLGSQPDVCFHPTYCCAQFILTREAILRRSRHFYRLALKQSLDEGVCWVLEHAWHAIFRKGEKRFRGGRVDELLKLAAGQPVSPRVWKV